MGRNTYGGAILMFAACALLAGVAGAAGTQNSGTAGNSNADPHAGHNMGGTTQDSKFAMFAAMGGMAEVEMGRTAAQKGASEDVRQFGRRMVDDHTKANEQLTQLASSKGMTLPAALDAKHQAAMQKMSGMSGEKFDREYARMMVADHKKTVGEFQKEAQRGADPELKAFAAAQLPALQEHLRMAQRLNDKLMLRRSGNLKTVNANSGGGTTNAGGNSNSNR